MTKYLQDDHAIRRERRFRRKLRERKWRALRKAKNQKPEPNLLRLHVTCRHCGRKVSGAADHLNGRTFQCQSPWEVLQRYNEDARLAA
jgi:hypothetical protein